MTTNAIKLVPSNELSTIMLFSTIQHGMVVVLVDRACRSDDSLASIVVREKLFV